MIIVVSYFANNTSLFVYEKVYQTVNYLYLISQDNTHIPVAVKEQYHQECLFQLIYVLNKIPFPELR